MPIPSVSSLFDPFLRELKDGTAKKMSEISADLAKLFSLDSDELKQLLPSGKESVFNSRVGWTRTYLKKAGLIEYVTWGVFRITDEGVRALKKLGDNSLDLVF